MSWCLSVPGYPLDKVDKILKRRKINADARNTEAESAWYVNELSYVNNLSSERQRDLPKDWEPWDMNLNFQDTVYAQILQQLIFANHAFYFCTW